VLDISDGICTYILGGLGNQLFMLAAAWQQAERLGCPLYVDTSWFRHPGKPHAPLLAGLKHPGVDISDQSPWAGRPMLPGSLAAPGLTLVDAPGQSLQLFTEAGFGYDAAISEITVGTTISGYFQAPQYFAGIADKVELMLREAPLSSAEMRYIQSVATDRRVSLHVRRGDYLDYAERFGLAEPGYFLRATKLYSRIDPAARYRIYSDSPELAMAELAGIANAELAIDQSDLGPMASVLALATADGIVISNSTFSWWAGWLISRQNDDATVIAPRPWHIDGDRVGEMLLPDWITLDARGKVDSTSSDGPRAPRPTATSPDVSRQQRIRSTRRAALAVEAAIDAQTLSAQIEAVADATRGTDAEVVILAPAGVPALQGVLERATGAKLVACPGVPGRRLSQQLALHATDADSIVYLGPMALPDKGFLEPLLDQLAAGAAVAGPLIDGIGALLTAADGSLRPAQPADDEPTRALALDCLAARREVWEAAPSALRMRDGFPEIQFADWALTRGELAVSRDSTVRRVASDPISIVLCSRDHADWLHALVPLLVEFGATQAGGEVVVVDNASTDGTAEVCRELEARYPGVVCVYEEEPGLSVARNTGAANARHRGLCYTDDDARPSPGWHKSIAWALSRGGVAAAGGPIAALWPEQRAPDWLDQGLEGNYAVLDLGDAVKLLSPPGEDVWGPSWAVTRDALMAVGGFDRELGMSPGSRIRGEETAVLMRIARASVGAVLYTPWANVGHVVPSHRLSDKYLIEHQLISGLTFHQLIPERYAGDEGQSLLLSEVMASLRRLLTALPLKGEHDLVAVLDKIEAAPTALTQRVNAGRELGLLAGGVILLGEDTLVLDDLTLRFRQENLRGHIR
jgi:hypothetical protein